MEFLLHDRYFHQQSCASNSCTPVPPPLPPESPIVVNAIPNWTEFFRPPPPRPARPAGDSKLKLLTFVLASISILIMAAVVLMLVASVIRRLRRLRRRNAAGDDSGQRGGGEGQVTRVWFLRTAGLDEDRIRSIPVVEFRSGEGIAAGDCAVCLGEFHDGELLRLLPRCRHAFHVHCIDTWLRERVTCPLCRADVLLESNSNPPPAVTAAAGVESTGGASFNPNSGDTDQARPEREEQVDERLRVVVHELPPAVLPPGARAPMVRWAETFDLLPPTSAAADGASPAVGRALRSAGKLGCGRSSVLPF